MSTSADEAGLWDDKILGVSQSNVEMKISFFTYTATDKSLSPTLGAIGEKIDLKVST